MGDHYELCVGCGKPFLKKRANQKFHGDSCRYKAWRKNKVLVDIGDLPPHIRQQIAEWKAVKRGLAL